MVFLLLVSWAAAVQPKSQSAFLTPHRENLVPHRRDSWRCLALLQMKSDPFCSSGLAALDRKACCQKDCGECNNNSTVCTNAATNGRGSTCCPSQIISSAVTCEGSMAPCLMAASTRDTKLSDIISAPGERNAAFDCNQAIPKEMMRQRVGLDFLKLQHKVLLPSPPDLDCSPEEWTSVEQIAYACEQRSECGGFTTDAHDDPQCLVGTVGALAESTVTDSTDHNMYVRVTDHHGYTFHYEVSEWHECSVTCGGGSQMRDLFCRNEDGHDYDLPKCQGIYSVAGTPDVQQDCNTEPCPCEAGEVLRSNGNNITTVITYQYEAEPMLQCGDGQPGHYTGELSTRCEIYTVGTLHKTRGRCYRMCLPSDDPISDNGAYMTLAANLIHEATRTLRCPDEGWSGQVGVRCDDGSPHVDSGRCWKDCKVDFADHDDHLTRAPMNHEEQHTLDCTADGWSGQVTVGCNDGTMMVAEGRCWHDCPVNLANNDATLTDSNLDHEEERVVQCPDDGWSGDVTFRCDDGVLSDTAGQCYKDCFRHDILETGGAKLKIPSNLDHGGSVELDCHDEITGEAHFYQNVEAVCNDGLLEVGGRVACQLVTYGWTPSPTEWHACVDGQTTTKMDCYAFEGDDDYYGSQIADSFCLNHVGEEKGGTTKAC